MSGRILFVDHAGVLGGAELYLLDVVRHYRERAHVVLFEAGPFADRLACEGVSVEVIPASPALLGVGRKGKALQQLKAGPAVLALARRLAGTARQADVVFANSQKALVVAALAGRWARRPVVWNLHDIITADHFSAVNRRLAVLLSRGLVDRVIVNSEATREAFVESGGERAKTGLVHNGIDPDRFDAVSDRDVEELRGKLGLEGKPVVGLFGRLAPWKGQHVLLEALPRLPGVHALLVGEALFGQDRAYAAELRSRAAQLDVSERVHFLGFRTDVPALMRMVDVVVHASTAAEPFGRVIAEGQVAGRPVVATAAGGAREIVADGQTGRLVPPGDAEALAAVVRELLDGPEGAARMAEAARAVARQRYSIGGMFRALDAELGGLVA